MWRLILLLCLLTASIGCPREAIAPAEAVGDIDTHRGPYLFTQDWFSHHRPRLKQIIRQHVRQPARYLELGAGEGVAFFWLMDKVLDHQQSRGIAVLTGYDGDRHGRFYDNLAASPQSWRLEVRKGDAGSAVARQEADRSLDLVFVHGASSAAENLSQMVLAWQALKWGGLLIVDDYQQRPSWPKSTRAAPAIDGFITAFRQQLTLVHREDLVVLRKRFPCGDECTRWRGYSFDWRRRILTNDANGQPVTLTVEEQKIVERVFRSSPYGEPEPVTTASVVAKPGYRALARRLGWLPSDSDGTR